MRRGEVILAGIARCLISIFRSCVRARLRFLVFKNCIYILWLRPFGLFKVLLSADMIERFLLLCFTSTTNLIRIPNDVSKLSSYGCSSAILIHNVKE